MDDKYLLRSFNSSLEKLKKADSTDDINYYKGILIGMDRGVSYLLGHDNEITLYMDMVVDDILKNY